MFNRLGSHGYGPSGNLGEVAASPHKFDGYNKGRVTPAQAEYIRSRIRAIAAGSVPDNTGGATEFRTSTYAPFVNRHPEGRDIGGNFFAPVGPPGPYRAYSRPNLSPRSDATPSGVPSPWAGASGPGAWVVGADLGGGGWTGLNNALPVGAAGVSGGSTDKSVTVNQTNNVNVSGVSDPNAAAGAIGSHLDRTSTDVARNLRGAAQ
jgi:hypothetical protein